VVALPLLISKRGRRVLFVCLGDVVCVCFVGRSKNLDEADGYCVLRLLQDVRNWSMQCKWYCIVVVT